MATPAVPAADVVESGYVLTWNACHASTEYSIGD
jgi:hypothetical protein